MKKLMDANGKPIPPTEAELKLEQERQATLSLRIFGCFEKPINTDDLLSAGVNLIIQFIYNGDPATRVNRFEFAMNTWEKAVGKAEELYVTKAAAQIPLKH